MKTLPIFITVLATGLLASCADMPQRDPRDVDRDCPVGMIQVCEGTDKPTRPGDDTPVYERCRCEMVTM